MIPMYCRDLKSRLVCTYPFYSTRNWLNGNNFLKVSFAEVKTSVTDCLQFTDGYAPFLSMTSRETFLNVSDQVVAAPGPGHYDPQNAQDGITVSTWIHNFTEKYTKLYKSEWNQNVNVHFLL